MQRVITNIFTSKVPLMIILRFVLVGAIAALGIARLRLLIIWLSYPNTFIDRDILQEYLMAKALLNGVNPYLPSVELVHKFVGMLPYYPNPAPYPPFVILLSIPLNFINVNQLNSVWFVIEIMFLIALSAMLYYYWKDKIDWKWSLPASLMLFAWFPVMFDLFWGQLSILITLLLMGAFLALRKDHRTLAGVIIGFTVAIKLITWPLIIYWLLKKNWRSAFVSIITALVLNLIALVAVGSGPFMDYYLRVSEQVFTIWRGCIFNFSLSSLGYRLFEGSTLSFVNYYKVPPLLNLPHIAPVISAGLMISFLVAGMVWAVRSKDQESAYGIITCVILAISPLSWFHYYVISIIALIILWRNFVKRSFPTWLTFFSILITLLLLLFNEYIEAITVLLNGGSDLVMAAGNQLSFLSSLLFWLPELEIIGLTILLWKSRERVMIYEVDHNAIQAEAI